MREELRLNCKCSICLKEFSTFNNPEPKAHDTIESVANELIHVMEIEHLSVSPSCKATPSDIMVMSCKYGTK